MSEELQVAIDGPASAGKSTVAKLVAKKFKYVYCDTGAMYRAITLAAMQAKVALDDDAAVTNIAQATVITFKPGNRVQQVFIGQQDITQAIRKPEVTNNVSTVAAIKDVRTEMVKQQRVIASHGGIVMDGRDIGTTVLPNAQVKIFLVASAHERAVRRYNENIKKGIETPLVQLQKEIEIRDKKDSTRAVSPLKQAEDAVLVDTTSLSIDQVVKKISTIIMKIQHELS
ncbi:cytidylate kinase [Paucilactobacillus hokkaidonensis JCM 18461]|uniref:Cytidylate kinase n=2 Tax=Paucilactobacillus hokkaidonensis TaxID=1193095 RepID=A0A0A1GTW0_9LACO|nr:(d)CMP kinase [Paucilactobacillus hokkaidonensis]KRO10690.1 cytidylate kinase [Paucilactobacillus hokkaidonensis]BAP85682.1 cytidylate kinase [Paucilactobacillus hokkaidonensis JCM 18461]